MRSIFLHPGRESPRDRCVVSHSTPLRKVPRKRVISAPGKAPVLSRKKKGLSDKHCDFYDLMFFSLFWLLESAAKCITHLSQLPETSSYVILSYFFDVVPNPLFLSGTNEQTLYSRASWRRRLDTGRAPCQARRVPCEVCVLLTDACRACGDCHTCSLMCSCGRKPCLFKEENVTRIDRPGPPAMLDWVSQQKPEVWSRYCHFPVLSDRPQTSGPERRV